MWKLTPAADASALVYYGIALLAIAMATLLVVAIARTSRRRGAIAAFTVTALMAGEFALAATGLLQRTDVRPPPLNVLLVVVTLATITFGFSRIGTALLRSLPMAALIGAQAFRLPLELVMHQAAAERVMPPQLSFDGFNFDILTGVTAIAVAGLVAAGRMPRTGIWAWNLMGLGLLIGVVSLSVASSPALHLFGPDKVSTWIAHAPFVWLPGVLVQIALLGHLLVFRKL